MCSKLDETFLSYGSKEIFIKLGLQAIPTYTFFSIIEKYH